MTLTEQLRASTAIGIINDLDEAKAICDVVHLAMESVPGDDGPSLALVLARACMLIKDCADDLRHLENVT